MTTKRTPTPESTPAEALRAALADYTKATYGIPIENYADAWLNSPDGDERFPFGGLDLVDLYNRLAIEKK